MNMNLSLSVRTIFPTTFGLAILLVATLASVETFPSVESSIMPSLLSMSKMKIKRNAS